MTTNKTIDHFFNLTQKYFRTYLAIAILVFIFILFFQPFDIEKFEYENNLVFVAGFGVLVLLFLFVSQILFQTSLIQTENESQDHTIYLPLYYFTQVATTSLAFIFYLRFVGLNSITFSTVARVVLICISLPVTMFLHTRLGSYRIRLKNLSAEKRSLQDKLKRYAENYANKYVEIISENNQDNFKILVSDIVYVKSADNYIEVGYQEEGLVRKKMIRGTLQNVEQQLAEFNNFIRTHRTSLVNIHYIKELNKNFNTYWLSLYHSKESIPVSRQHLLAVKELL